MEAKMFLNELDLLIRNDETVIKSRYKKIFGKELDLENPKTFNEKINWRILRDHNPIYTLLSDKYMVRKYVEKKIGSKYLIPLIGVYDKPEDINYDTLSKKFVLKCTHDSGSVFICHDKSKIDKYNINKIFKKYLKRNYYKATREYQYKNISPRIICEEFISDDGCAPIDYKFHVFNTDKYSKIFIQCDIDRFTSHTRAMLNENWEYANFEYKVKRPRNLPEKPKNFKLMKKLALTLSKDFDMVRVDLYEVNNNIYFGELTFTSENGIQRIIPYEWDEKLGDLWNLK